MLIDGREEVLKGGAKNATNNQMELRAVIESIKSLKEPSEVLIISDSKEYVVDGINKQDKHTANPDLWEEYQRVAKGHKITVQWAERNSTPELKRCDEIAKAEAEKQK